MDWVEHLLRGDRSPLGFKRLNKPSAGVTDFLKANAELPVARQALSYGEAGYYVPNMADTGNRLSVWASFFFLNNLLTQVEGADIGIVGSGQAFGSTLEERIASGLSQLIGEHHLDFTVSTKSDAQSASFRLTNYWPYLSPPSRAGEPGEEAMYRALGRGHLIQPDVIVWKNRQINFARVKDGRPETFAHQAPQLFACISGKATIRSDRSQSSRYEGTALGRWRRARPPHIVVVTAEPLPARLGSLAWGLGDLDCVYHANVSALYDAVVRAEAAGSDRVTRAAAASGELKDLIEHARLKDLSQLFDDLFSEVTGTQA